LMLSQVSRDIAFDYAPTHERFALRRKYHFAR
jgi:hypothetical protein